MAQNSQKKPKLFKTNLVYTVQTFQVATKYLTLQCILCILRLVFSCPCLIILSNCNTMCATFTGSPLPHGVEI